MYDNQCTVSSRTRGLNSALYWGAQMLGAYLLGRLFLDCNAMSRRQRAMGGLIIVTACFTSAWAIGLYLQVGMPQPGLTVAASGHTLSKMGLS
jgi:hypothetical protein